MLANSTLQSSQLTEHVIPVINKSWNHHQAQCSLVKDGMHALRKVYMLSNPLSEAHPQCLLWSWWQLFPCMWGLLLISEESGTNRCPPALFFLNEDKLAHANSTLWARISSQWLSEPRRQWLSIPWWGVCELVFLIGSHTKPGEHGQPTLTLFDQGCMHV